MAISRRVLLLTSFVACLMVSRNSDRQAFADSSQPKVSVDPNKVAIQGYDVVAYFTDGKPTKGSPDFEAEWFGARWQFASKAHRDLFSSQPDTYAPRFGGYCAGAMIDGVFVRPDPEAWAIIDGRLYLNGSKDGLVDWQQDPAANIAKAQTSWESFD
jgi:hypothetical protein